MSVAGADADHQQDEDAQAEDDAVERRRREAVVGHRGAENGAVKSRCVPSSKTRRNL